MLDHIDIGGRTIQAIELRDNKPANAISSLAERLDALERSRLRQRTLSVKIMITLNTLLKVVDGLEAVSSRNSGGPSTGEARFQFVNALPETVGA